MVAHQCRKFGIPLWQCPHFLFSVMGLLIIFAILGAYALGSRIIDDPYIINLIIFSLTGILLIIAFTITHSFERLAEANRLKSEFVSIVSHQLRAPLTNFTWALDLLAEEEKEVPERQRGYFRILSANADRMQELVNDLLMTSRIQEGRLPFQKNPFSFPELLDTIVTNFKPIIEASNIEVRIEQDPEVSTITSDANKLNNILSNLLDNAVKYTKKAIDTAGSGGGIISIRYRKQGKSLYFEIEDNGIGIPKEDEKYIFRKFFRASNVQKHETQGTGLGLYIVRSIVEKAGGSMGFRSRENKGSTFWFQIPLT